MKTTKFIEHGFSKVLTEKLEELDLQNWEKTNIEPSGCSGEKTHRTCLVSMAKGLGKSMRGVSFAWKRNVRSDPEMWVYMKDMPYTMGYIGYGDFNTHVSSDTSEYIVYAYPIRNCKYSAYSAPYHMVKTIHMDKALKNACKWLRNPNVYDIASVNLYQAKSKFEDIGRVLTDKLRHVRENMYNQSKLAEEFRAILNSGYEFIDKSFGVAISEFIEAYDISKERDRKILNLYHVRVYMEDDQQKFDVVPFSNIHKNFDIDSWVGEVTTYTEDTLPEDIMGKLSCLTMLKEEEFVDDVGYKDGGGSFYVTQ